MYTPISESLGKEKLILKASAATVGRPSGVNGKKMAPRRARVTSKELEKLTTKGLKAGGPGSGRHSTGQNTYKAPNKKEDEQSHKDFHKAMKQHGFSKDSKEGVFVKKSQGKNHVIVPLYSDHGNKQFVTQFRHSVTDKVSNYDSESKYKHEGEPSELHDYLTKKGL